MANRLSLLFTGLCGIVPKLPLDKPNNQATVLLVDAMATLHEPHVPVLVCSASSVAAGRKPDLLFGKDKAAFFLIDQELTVFGSTCNSLSFNYSGATGLNCPIPDDPNDPLFSDWIVPLEAISAGSGAVRDACLFNPPQVVDPKVLARIRLQQGTVQTMAIARDSSGQALNWQFLVPPPAPGIPIARQQALAEVVELTHDIGGASSIDLVTTKLRNKSQYQLIEDIFGVGTTTKISLNGVGTPGNLIVQAVVKNIPWPDLFDLRPKPPVAFRLTDTHFDHFYDLSVTPGTRNVPDPLLASARCAKVVTPGPANPQCPPTRYGVNGNA
jgi:hypothetical protein